MSGIGLIETWLKRYFMGSQNLTAVSVERLFGPHRMISDGLRKTAAYCDQGVVGSDGAKRKISIVDDKVRFALSESPSFSTPISICRSMLSSEIRVLAMEVIRPDLTPEHKSFCISFDG